MRKCDVRLTFTSRLDEGIEWLSSGPRLLPPPPPPPPLGLGFSMVFSTSSKQHLGETRQLSTVVGVFYKSMDLLICLDFAFVVSKFEREQYGHRKVCLSRGMRFVCLSCVFFRVFVKVLVRKEHVVCVDERICTVTGGLAGALRR